MPRHDLTTRPAPRQDARAERAGRISDGGPVDRARASKSSSTHAKDFAARVRSTGQLLQKLPPPAVAPGPIANFLLFHTPGLFRPPATPSTRTCRRNREALEKLRPSGRPSGFVPRSASHRVGRTPRISCEAPKHARTLTDGCSSKVPALTKLAPLLPAPRQLHPLVLRQSYFVSRQPTIVLSHTAARPPACSFRHFA